MGNTRATRGRLKTFFAPCDKSSVSPESTCPTAASPRRWDTISRRKTVTDQRLAPQMLVKFWHVQTGPGTGEPYLADQAAAQRRHKSGLSPGNGARHVSGPSRVCHPRAAWYPAASRISFENRSERGHASCATICCAAQCCPPHSGFHHGHGSCHINAAVAARQADQAPPLTTFKANQSGSALD